MEAHNERQKEQYKSNPDIDTVKSFLTLAIAAGIALGIFNNPEKRDEFLEAGLASAGPFSLRYHYAI